MLLCFDLLFASIKAIDDKNNITGSAQIGVMLFNINSLKMSCICSG